MTSMDVDNGIEDKKKEEEEIVEKRRENVWNAIDHKKRFIAELEFMHCLANPSYIHGLERKSKAGAIVRLIQSEIYFDSVMQT